MRRWVWAALFAAGVVGFQLALFNLLDAGTCASGGPYVIGNRCPSGTTAWTLTLFGSIALIFVAGIGIGLLGSPRRRAWGPERGWLLPFAFVPTTHECAAFSSLTAAVALLAGEPLFAGGTLVLGLGTWLAGRGISAAADRRAVLPSRDR